MYRQAILRQTRLFSTSVRVRKSAVDQAKETLQSVDKSVASTIVKGIEKAEEATGMSEGEVKGKASEMQGKAQGTVSEMSGKASEMAGQAKGKANEVAGEAKGKAEEVKQKM